MDSKSKLQLNHYLFITIGILILIIILQNTTCKGKLPDPTPVLNYNYVTDTVYVDKPYEVKKDNNDIVTQPKTMIKWLKPDPIKIDSVAIYNKMVAIYTDSTKTPILVNPDFLTHYKDAEKLISFDLKKDTLSLTTFSTNAEVVTNNYPLYLENFGYTYYDNKLHRYEVKSTPPATSKLNWKEVYINGGYSILNEKPLLGIEYNLTPGRFKIDIDSHFTIEDTPQLNLTGKIGYRLFK